MQSLVDYSKKYPNGLTYASPGNGSIGHLTGELLKTATGANLLHVPYKGAAPATADLIGGQVDLGFSSIPAVLPHISSGLLKAIAVTTDKRVSAVPQLPTISESGFPGLSAYGWYAVVGPVGIPEVIITKINSDVTQVLADPEVRAKLALQGLEPWTMTPQELRSYMQIEVARWRKVINISNIKAD